MINALKSLVRGWSPGKRRTVFIIFIPATFLLIAGFIASIYTLRVYYSKVYGIYLTPVNVHEIVNIPYYLQNDSQWGGETIGDSNRKMSGAGCLITCVANAMDNLGLTVTPGDVNAKLTEAGGFQGADLIWYKINEIWPEIQYRYTRDFSSALIESDLSAGLLPIVNVKIHGVGATHWLLVVGAVNGEFMAFDPLNKEKKPIPLSTHGKVYAYRVLYKNVLGTNET